MRLCTYEAGGRIGVGVERAGAVYPTRYADMLALIRDGEEGLRARRRRSRASPVAVDRLLAPIPRPGTIFGSGVNFRSHGDEEPGFVFPDEPQIDFIKTPNAVIGPDDADRDPARTTGSSSGPTATRSITRWSSGSSSAARPATSAGPTRSTTSSATPSSTTWGRAACSSRSGRGWGARPTWARTSTPSCRWGRSSSPPTRFPDLAQGAHPRLGQRRVAPGRRPGRATLPGARPDRVDQLDHHDGTGRLHLHRHPGRVRHLPPTARLPPTRRRRHRRRGDDRRADEPGRGRLTGPRLAAGVARGEGAASVLRAGRAPRTPARRCAASGGYRWRRERRRRSAPGRSHRRCRRRRACR